MRKVVSIAVLLCFCLALMVGCSKDNSEQTESGSELPSSEISSALQSEQIDAGKLMAGYWSCAETPLENDSYVGYYVLRVEADGEFSLYDAEAGNPGICGTLTFGQTDEIALNCETDDFDPPYEWKGFEISDTLRYKFISDDEMHLIYTLDDGSVSTFVFTRQKEE